MLQLWICILLSLLVDSVLIVSHFCNSIAVFSSILAYHVYSSFYNAIFVVMFPILHCIYHTVKQNLALLLKDTDRFSLIDFYCTYCSLLLVVSASGLLNLLDLDPLKRFLPAVERPRQSNRYSSFQVVKIHMLLFLLMVLLSKFCLFDFFSHSF